jgi:hypothetical protein
MTADRARGLCARAAVRAAAVGAALVAGGFAAAALAQAPLAGASPDAGAVGSESTTPDAGPASAPDLLRATLRSEGGALLFHYQEAARAGSEGEEEVEVTWSTAAGEVVVREEARLSAHRLRRYRARLAQWHETATAEVSGGKVRLALWGNNPPKQAEDDVDHELAAPATLVRTLRRHLAELRAGRAVEIQLVLVEGCRTVAMRAERVDGAEGLVLRVSPSSFLVRLLAGGAATVALDPLTGAPLWYRGRVLPKALDERGLQDVDGLLVFEGAK